MIQIFDDWYVTVEPYPANYVVRRGKGERDKKGKWLDKSRGYFGSLRNAVKEIRKQYAAEQLSDGKRTLEEALRIVSSIDDRFDEIMERVTA